MSTKEAINCCHVYKLEQLVQHFLWLWAGSSIKHYSWCDHTPIFMRRACLLWNWTRHVPFPNISRFFLNLSQFQEKVAYITACFQRSHSCNPNFRKKLHTGGSVGICYLRIILPVCHNWWVHGYVIYFTYVSQRWDPTSRFEWSNSFSISLTTNIFPHICIHQPVSPLIYTSTTLYTLRTSIHFQKF